MSFLLTPTHHQTSHFLLFKLTLIGAINPVDEVKVAEQRQLILTLTKELTELAVQLPAEPKTNDQGELTNADLAAYFKGKLPTFHTSKTTQLSFPPFPGNFSKHFVK